MSLQVEKLEHNMAKLTIEAPADELEKALQSAYLKQRPRINVPGFRKGKVPRQIISIYIYKIKKVLFLINIKYNKWVVDQ